MKKTFLIALTSLIAPMLAFSAPPIKSEPIHTPPPPEIPDATPAYGPLEGHKTDFVVDAEFLWWLPNIANTSYAIKRVGKLIVPNDTSVGTPPTNKEEFNWDWDPGVRLGVGAVTSHDGWDVYLNWTYFHTRASASHDKPLFEDFAPGVIAYTSPWFLDPNEDEYPKLSASIAFTYNQIDLEKGRRFWISRNLTLRPSMGIRGYWSRIHMNVKGNSGRSAEDTETGAGIFERTAMKQQSWGVGLLAGFETVWHFYSYWSVFSSTDIALTYGKMRQTKKMSYEDSLFAEEETEVGQATLSDRQYHLQPILDLALGVRWENTLYESKFRLLFDLGWEFHYLYDHNQLLRGTNNNASTTDQVPANGDASMNGLVLRGRFEF